ncbi:MAG: hypothetical protein ABI693_33855 [Bryobacteraceae bacterium]
MKRFVPLTALVPGMFGFFALFNSLGKERVAALHGSDVVGLVAAGFCFGVTFMILVVWSIARKERSAAG